jgi:hypothetical protein
MNLFELIATVAGMALGTYVALCVLLAIVKIIETPFIWAHRILRGTPAPGNTKEP